MATKTTLIDFQGNYEVKNGYIGDETVLNAAPDKLKKELDLLWEATLGARNSVTEGNANDPLQFYDAGEFGVTTTI